MKSQRKDIKAEMMKHAHTGPQGPRGMGFKAADEAEDTQGADHFSGAYDARDAHGNPLKSYKEGGPWQESDRPKGKRK